MACLLEVVIHIISYTMGMFLYTKSSHPQGTIENNAGQSIATRYITLQDKQENDEDKYHSHGIYY